jgi:hypothetical protein
MADHASLRDSLLATRNRLTEEREPKVFELPGYGKDLQVKYRVLTRQERKEALGGVVKLAQAGEERAAERGMCSTLAKACVGFYTEQDGKTVSLNEAEGLGEDLIRWGDERLAELFGMDVSAGSLRAREVIEYVLGTDDILELHHGQIDRWMDQVLKADDEDF